MNYSRSHTSFAYNLYRFNGQDVLEHPENYLGPNYKEVLNYWFYKDSFSYEQLKVYSDRWPRNKLNSQTFTEAYVLARKLALKVIDPRFVKQLYYEERELVAAHLYIEQGIPFTFLPLIFDL